jgi:hypothetical protein
MSPLSPQTAVVDEVYETSRSDERTRNDMVAGAIAGPSFFWLCGQVLLVSIVALLLRPGALATAVQKWDIYY